ncbi:hypothetical protein HRG_000441 [Hirsutella rhossiliensis]|uniref:Uncharacterized protein n=1 Tax=Hirsutella rhossiliensis TaxID=111463 RepID=A0A9P8N8R1_9HYPO|nr:uncharacterized protein HRG_00441 [Hirsutella rhossiliensis]KAH0967799.1 hypothetical protein HRG_00441 [Hirsutella rhossiliensis]
MRYNQLNRLRRFSSSSSCASASSTTSRCSSRGPPVEDHDDGHDSRAPRGRQDSTASTTAPRRSCEGMTAAETRGLWQCMLELQQRYGCYNSTRIDLAVHAGDEGARLMPNPFIIDTLNNSVVDLPAEGWQKLDRCLIRTAPSSSPKPKPKRRFWSRH